MARMESWTAFFLAVCCTTMARVAGLACSPGLVSLVVEDSAGALALANATSCTGGEFEVLWVGYVEFLETIYVTAGTILNVTGADAGAVADGQFTNQFLNVDGGTVHMSGMRIEHCSADFGGAVFANASSLSFNATEFVRNTANIGGEGGAIYADTSSLHWSGKTVFSDNSVAGESYGGGGAIYALNSSVYWSGETSFLGNIAKGGLAAIGGALCIDQSNASWSGETIFSDNVVAGELAAGSAVYALNSSVYWSGETTWTGNVANSTGGNGTRSAGGGALMAIESRVLWDGETSFLGNTAAEGEISTGGALEASFESSVYWSGETRFFYNVATAVVQAEGGAVRASGDSIVSWSGATSFSNNGVAATHPNTSSGNGGAFCASFADVSWSAETSFSSNVAYGRLVAGGAFWASGSTVYWGVKTSFSNNTAEAHFSGNLGHGGGLFASNSGVSWSGETSYLFNRGSGGSGLSFVRSNVSWSAETIFSGNDGSALQVQGSSVFWSAATSFVNNTGSNGGGLHALQEAVVSWSGETNFTENTASTSGGALYVDSSNVSWNGVTSFSRNSAGVDGGAVYAHVWYAGDYDYAVYAREVLGEVPLPSHVSWFAGTTFSTNHCSGSGGAMALVGEVYHSAQTAVFEGNTAEISGGAVFLSDVGSGPVFVHSSFTGNISPQGGAVYSVSSGTASLGGTTYPVVYEECLFTGNEASRTGGAAESVAGYDDFVNCIFQGNSAGAGGALRLGGSTSLTNCEFVDNESDEDGGPAISNVGALFLYDLTMFAGNDFWCENGTYQDSADGNRLSKVCDGCDDECSGCEVEDASSMPICSSTLEHTRSEGGATTIETLEVNAGYWRANPTSPDVLACYNEDACLGGLTGSQGYCLEGYEGPYCSVCSEEYAMTLSFTCTKCVDSHGGIAIMVVVAVLCLCAIIALFMHLVSGEVDGARGIIHRVTKRLPLQSIKIIVVVWQILTQFTSVANVAYPPAYQRFLDGVNVLNFDLLWIPSAGCIIDADFHDRLLVSTTGPLVALALLAATFTVASHRNRGSETALERVRHKHMSMVLLISFLVYSSVSATVFQTFACEDLDDGKNYLRADYRIECDSSKHHAFEFYAYVMVVVYPVGIPLFYAYLLYTNRLVLASEGDAASRETSSQVQPISDLWAPYKPGRFYYEVLECIRRIMLTGVVVFIYPNTAAQVAVTLMVAFLFVALSLFLAPYVSKWDGHISLAGHIIVFTSMYTALLGRVDVSDERDVNQEVFANVLVAAHACLIFAVVAETVVMMCSMGLPGSPKQQEGPRPKVHCAPPVDSFPKDTVLSS